VERPGLNALRIWGCRSMLAWPWVAGKIPARLSSDEGVGRGQLVCRLEQVENNYTVGLGPTTTTSRDRTRRGGYISPASPERVTYTDPAKVLLRRLRLRQGERPNKPKIEQRSPMKRIT